MNGNTEQHTCICGKVIEDLNCAYYSWLGNRPVLGPSCSASCHKAAIIEDKGFKPRVLVTNGDDDDSKRTAV